MSSAPTTRRAAIIIGGISAAIFCASSVLRWYFNGRSWTNKVAESSSSPNLTADKGKKKGRSSASQDDIDDRKRTKAVEESDADSELSTSSIETEMATSVASFSMRDAGRGGRRDYRHHRRPKEESNGCCTSMRESNNALTNPLHRQGSAGADGFHHQTANLFNDPAIVEVSASVAADGGTSVESSVEWAPTPECTRCAANDGEIRGAQLAAEFEAKCQMAISTTLSDKQISSEAEQSAGEDTICNTMMLQQGPNHVSSPLSSVKVPCIESPPLSSDLQSEGSQDSGKGASTGLLSSMSPVEEMIEIPAVYEFEVPQDIVGLLIGKQGSTIKWLTQQSQAHIVIRQHFYSDRHKICTLEGTREQINMCLRYIRRKFPPSRFPDLKLTPIIIPPTVTASHTPVWDNVIQLNLPEGVSCDVVVSSVVNAGQFFVQQPTHPTFPSLTRLDQYMVAVYGQPVGVPQLPRPVDAGIICAAPVLGGWYRAQTMEVYDDTDEALVKFVDYGGYSRMPVSELRQIRSDFMTLPFQATECYLAHVKPTTEDGWSQEDTAAFEQLSQGKVIEASVLGHARDNVPVVELFLPAEDSTVVSISRLLSTDGHATWTD